MFYKMVDKRYLKGILLPKGENRMYLPTTETVLSGAPLDAVSSDDAVCAMLVGQHAALDAITAATPALISGAQAMAATIRSGGSLVYAAAGSSGLMALADASELAGTFGISPDAVKIFMAGGVPVDAKMPGDVEDDVDLAVDVLRYITPRDIVIVLSASGSTPYALAVAKGAKAAGANVIGVANNRGAALLSIADIAVCIETPAEVIAGSTRLGAGTTQKVALNIMSTLMGVDLGHVYRGMMVNVVADNAKLVERAAGIVSEIADVSVAIAKDALQQTNGNPKTAILVAKGATAAQAVAAIAAHDGHLGPCLK
ncbi:MAG: N-acetylmuramic acid 6-phosphate etherase [Yoonia sp.]|jgi:N-acetylmuramic acid 6-phosphate etherase